MSELKSWLGLAAYYGKYIPHMATKVSPLYKLLRKGTEFKWTQHCQEAFDSVKTALTSAPILGSPDINKGPFTLT